MNNKPKTTASRPRWSFGRQAVQAPAPPLPLPPPPPPLSRFSSGGVPDSSWASSDFMLGVGMVIIQPTTDRIVLVYEAKLKYWFFPRGRKDVGETLEQAALREAYEESGYRAEFLPLCHLTRQPSPPDNPDARMLPNVEPVYITFKSWDPKKRTDGVFMDAGGEYITTWYAGQIPEDAVKDLGTGMPDELYYESYLVTFEEAIQRLWGQELNVLRYVWQVYKNTRDWEAQMAEAQLAGPKNQE